MMIARNQTMEMVVGYEFERRLANRMQSMLFEALTKANKKPDNAPSPYYPVGVNAHDSLGIAAAHTLCAAGLFTPDPEEDVGAEVHGFFAITEEGKRALLKRSVRHS